MSGERKGAAKFEVGNSISFSYFVSLIKLYPSNQLFFVKMKNIHINMNDHIYGHIILSYTFRNRLQACLKLSGPQKM